MSANYERVTSKLNLYNHVVFPVPEGEDNEVWIGLDVGLVSGWGLFYGLRLKDLGKDGCYPEFCEFNMFVSLYDETLAVRTTAALDSYTFDIFNTFLDFCDTDKGKEILRELPYAQDVSLVRQQLSRALNHFSIPRLFDAMENLAQSATGFSAPIDSTSDNKEGKTKL